MRGCEIAIVSRGSETLDVLRGVGAAWRALAAYPGAIDRGVIAETDRVRGIILGWRRRQGGV